MRNSNSQNIAVRDIAVVMAAKDEEITLKDSLDHLLKIFPPQNIYLINDCSSDNTGDIALTMGVQVLTNSVNLGKTRSLEKIIREKEICNKYKALLFIDADSWIDINFIAQVLPSLNKPDTAVVVGQVKSRYVANNPYIVYRYFAYVVWQQVWKRIFNKFNAIPISPGTASVYKTKIFTKLSLDPKLVIEDFDLTFQTHRKKLGKIVYEPKAIVFTQDPNNLKDYYRQMVRWNLGQLQPMVKHKIPFKFQSFELAIAYLFLQNIVYSLIILGIPLYVFIVILRIVTGLPWISPGFDKYINIVLLIDFVLVMGSIYLVTLRHHRKPPQLFVPIFWIIQFVNAVALFHAIAKLSQTKSNSIWKSPVRWSKR